MEKNNLPIIGISIGDYNGIGPEVIVKALNSTELLKSAIFVIYGSSFLLNNIKKQLQANEFNFQKIKSVNEATDKQINIINITEAELNIDLGVVTSEAGLFAINSLKNAVNDLKQNKLHALVTAPINKANVQSSDFNYAGHTDYLAAEFGISTSKYAMMLVSDELKVSLLTEHISIQKVSEHLTEKHIIEKIVVINNTLKSDFLIQKPRIAVLGLNPHAGDQGVIGKEELQIINPAIVKLNEQGVLCMGAYSADGFFANKMYKKFDCVVASYHDQGLIPFKSISFNEGVNYTGGLPIIRTSPDHGTAYDIAPKYVADENSFRQAVYTAIDAVKNRNNSVSWSKNPLPFSARDHKRNHHSRE